MPRESPISVPSLRAYGIKPAHLELFFNNRLMPMGRQPNDDFSMRKRYTTVKDLIGDPMSAPTRWATENVVRALQQAEGDVFTAT